MGWCVTSQNITVSLNDLLNRNCFRTVDCLELLWVWEDPGEDEIVHRRAAWLRRALSQEIYGRYLKSWDPWEPMGIDSREDWVYYLKYQISPLKREWLNQKENNCHLWDWPT